MVQSLAAWHSDDSAKRSPTGEYPAFEAELNPLSSLCRRAHTQATDRLISPQRFVISLHC